MYCYIYIGTGNNVLLLLVYIYIGTGNNVLL